LTRLGLERPRAAFAATSERGMTPANAGHVSERKPTRQLRKIKGFRAKRCGV